MTNKKFIIIIIVLVVCSIALGFGYWNAERQLQVVKNESSKVETNAKVVDFTSMFIKDVLQASKEVDFETRLKLENSVRDLNDNEIMAGWQSFIGSKTEQEAQNNVKSLLEILVSKIQK